MPKINLQPTLQPISVQLPNGHSIRSTHTCRLDLPHLPPSALQAHIFPDLANHALVSVGILCDHGCIAKFTKDHVIINKGDRQVLKGTRHANGLWYLDLANPPPAPHLAPKLHPSAHAAITSTSTRELIQFLHAACFSPTTSTWIKAINNGHFTTWPLLTQENV
jgi:hypothetical protein